MKALAPSRAVVCANQRLMLRGSIWLGSLLLLATGVPALAQQQRVEETSPAPQAGQETMPAVWKVREVSFSYNSSKSIYTCSALESRVKTIFLALGARDDLEVRVSNCNEMLMDDEFDTTLGRGGRSSDPLNRTWGRGGSDIRHESAWEDPYDRLRNRGHEREQNAYIRARLLMPVEMTREVMEEIKRDKSRRELISRVTRDPTAKQNDPVWFPAHWQPVTLSRDSIGLEPEECELLDQMTTSVFKELGLRVTDKGRRCSRMGGSRTSPALTVEALLMAPVGDTGLPEIKLEGEGETSAPPSAPQSSDQSDQ